MEWSGLDKRGENVRKCGYFQMNMFPILFMEEREYILFAYSRFDNDDSNGSKMPKVCEIVCCIHNINLKE